MVVMVHRIIENLSFGISLTGVIVVIWGTAEGAMAFVRDKFGTGRNAVLPLSGYSGARKRRDRDPDKGVPASLLSSPSCIC